MPDLSVLIKPASSLCNMRCKYCFYADVSDIREVKSYGVMSTETADVLIEKAFAAVGERGILNIAFQGGEPTLAGLPFFKYFAEKCMAFKPEKVELSFSIQTNGLLLDDEFCKFLAKYSFLVGLSLDGIRDYHDANRRTATGGTFDKVMESAERMKKYGVSFNILCVLTSQNASHAARLFDFFWKNDLRFVQFIPCLSSLENPDEVTRYTLTPRAYGAFLIDFFKIWADNLEKGRYLSVRLFDNYVRMAAGELPEMCGMTGFCSPQYVIEADGSVYPCDFYVLDEYRMGNIHDMGFPELRKSETLYKFLKELPAPDDRCFHCPVAGICGGGCRRYRSFYYKEDRYCPIAEFLTACAPKIKQISNIYTVNNPKE